jgi:hypothetical protein
VDAGVHFGGCGLGGGGGPFLPAKADPTADNKKKPPRTSTPNFVFIYSLLLRHVGNKNFHTLSTLHTLQPLIGPHPL